MRSGADVAARLALDRRIMQQAHHRIAVAHSVDEIILVDLQEARDRLEDLEPGRFERRVELPVGLLEALDLRGPDIVRHMIAERMAGWQIAADMPEFLE